ncbi:MAG TPA: ABC transporter permease [Gemmatimonadaceae bacterium]
MDTLLEDVRHALRRLRHAPAFTTVVVITLALGIGANSAIFSLVDTILLSPLPYRAPGELVTIQHHYPSIGLDAPVSAPGFRDYRDRTRSFSHVAVERQWSANLTGIGDPQRLRGGKVSGDFFAVLGVGAALGRTILPDEDAAGRDHVVVLSDGLWKRLYGAKRDAVGATMSLNGEPYRIVGVMPPSFRDFWSADVELWTPIALDPALFTPGNYTNEWLDLTARLRPGVTADAAAREMRAFADRLKHQYPDQFAPDWTLRVVSLDQLATGKIRPALLVLLGAVGFVLLIACANVANLLLARAAARGREVAIRTALGARRRDIVRQLLTESVLLSLAGGTLGLALAYWTVRSLVALNPGNIPRVAELRVNGTVVLFTLVVSVATGLLFGLAPALQAPSGDLRRTLSDAGGRGGTTDRGGRRLRRALVVSEIALALVLLTGAGLLIKSFARLSGVDPGFDPRDVLTFNLSLPATRYPNDTVRRVFFDRVIPAIAAVPGVKAVGGTSGMPFSGSWSTGSYNVEGYQPPPNGNGPWGDIRIITPGFPQALHLPLRRGHLFTDLEASGAGRVALVDEEFVRRYYRHGEDPIGRRIWFGPSTPDTSTRFITIVGVVGHSKEEALDAESRPQLYLPYAQTSDIDFLDIAVRTSGDPMRYVGAIRRAVQGVDPDQPLARIRSLDEMVSASMGQRRLSVVLLGVFAGIALLLATIGIYGIMSYSVTQRAREMGIRVALGARTADVLGLVLRQGMMLALVGVAAGLAGSLALTRLIASQLYAVRATDPATFATVALLLSAVAFVACMLPARRATRVDPVEVLRDE